MREGGITGRRREGSGERGQKRNDRKVPFHAFGFVWVRAQKVSWGPKRNGCDDMSCSVVSLSQISLKFVMILLQPES